MSTSSPAHTNCSVTALLLSYLQQPVSCLQAAILDGSSPRQNVLHIDGCWAADGNVSRRYTEAESLRSCRMRGEERRFYNGMWFISRQKQKLLYSPCAPVARATVNTFIFSWHSFPGYDVSLSSEAVKCWGTQLVQILVGSVLFYQK